MNMSAIVIDDYGSTEVLKLKKIPTPQPQAEELLVEVCACGLNPVDYKIRQGHLKDLFEVHFPRVLGGDISGVVKECGSLAKDFIVGDEVYFSSPLDRNGGYAEFCTVPQHLVAKKPPTLSHVEAASLPVVGLTSIQVLRDFANIRAGQRVLIHAGAGGVGSFAIQYAKYCKAEVLTTASEARREYLLALGADRVIDYRSEDFVEVCRQVGGMDIVFETIGGENYPRSIKATRDGGVVACIVNPPDSDTRSMSETRNIKTDFFLLTPNRSDLDEIARLVAGGIVKPIVSLTLPLQQVADGHRMLESGRTQGKIVLSL